MARLQRGTVAAERFDFSNLRWAGGRFGHEALERLKTTTDRPPADFIRETASRALLATNRYARLSDPEITAANVAIHTPDAKLPPTFPDAGLE
jgi:hypothetical protein